MIPKKNYYGAYDYGSCKVGFRGCWALGRERERERESGDAAGVGIQGIRGLGFRGFGLRGLGFRGLGFRASCFGASIPRIP